MLCSTNGPCNRNNFSESIRCVLRRNRVAVTEHRFMTLFAAVVLSATLGKQNRNLTRSVRFHTGVMELTSARNEEALRRLWFGHCSHPVMGWGARIGRGARLRSISLPL